MTAIYGRHTYGTLNIRAWSTEYAKSVITVGDFCSLADRIEVFLDGNHSYTGFSTFPFKESLGWDTPPNSWGKSIPVIGSDVWVGSDVTILSGVTIGHGAVIAAKTVVTKDVPSYAIVAGNPGRIKKYRFSKDIIDDLLLYPWWKLSDHLIKSELLKLDTVEQVITRVKELYCEYNLLAQ
jgi:acetyltransferase-like isoleucine patch superfamily enzyme